MTLSYWIVVALLILFYVWIFRGGRMIDRMLTDYYKNKKYPAE